ncbi:MAG: hypothetical protein FWG07_04905 [Treponema sp.]|nr:hypothetical protein [Treponema sp.]
MATKGRMVLFMLGATVFNILLVVICFFVLILFYSILLVPIIPENVSFIGLPLVLLSSFILSFLIYQKAIKLYLKKHPINYREINNHQT